MLVFLKILSYGTNNNNGGNPMKSHSTPPKSLISLLVAGALCGISNSALAGGFQLFEQNGVNVGDFAAGGAALAQDASTAYSNPAGLVRIQKIQVVGALNDIIAGMKFTGTQEWSYDPLGRFSPRFPESGQTNIGGNNFVPAFHLSFPLNDSVVFGFSVAAPYGLNTVYPDNSFVRYSATKTYLTVTDFSPNIGVRLSKEFSIGAGFDPQYLDAKLNTMGGSPLTARTIGVPLNSFDTVSNNYGHAWGYGWHLGGLYEFSPQTRFGLNYRSKTNYNVNGESSFCGPLADLFALPIPGTTTGPCFNSGNLRAALTLPATSTLSAYHDFTDKFALLGSVVYTQWSQFNDVTLENVAGRVLVISPLVTAPGLVNATIPNRYNNTFRVSLGANYHVTPNFLVRTGIGYDETPTISATRNIRLPDQNRYAFAVGGHYQFTNQLGMDVGWEHLIMQDALIDLTTTTSIQSSRVIGHSRNAVNVVGAQLTYNIG